MRKGNSEKAQVSEGVLTALPGLLLPLLTDIINSVSIDAINVSEIFPCYYFALKSARRKVRYYNTKTQKLK